VAKRWAAQGLSAGHTNRRVRAYVNESFETVDHQLPGVARRADRPGKLQEQPGNTHGAASGGKVDLAGSRDQ